MELYDNGTVDGDSISIFYNNKLLVSNRSFRKSHHGQLYAG